MWGSTNQLNIEYVNIRPFVYLILLLYIIEILSSINERELLNPLNDINEVNLQNDQLLPNQSCSTMLTFSQS